MSSGSALCLGKQFNSHLLSINAVTYMIASTVIGSIMKYVGRENTIMVGLIFIFIQNMALAYATTLEDPETFLALSFIAQAIGGVGSGINSVASMALVVKNSAKEDREMNIGFMEAFTGIGFLAGPLFGSFMFTLGGYVMPFAASAGLILLMYPIVCYNLI